MMEVIVMCLDRNWGVACTDWTCSLILCTSRTTPKKDTNVLSQELRLIAIRMAYILAPPSAHAHHGNKAERSR
ncbi:hypothetical protein OSTOST_11423 [Ostertagia ostertagi]